MGQCEQNVCTVRACRGVGGSLKSFHVFCDFSSSQSNALFQCVRVCVCVCVCVCVYGGLWGRGAVLNRIAVSGNERSATASKGGLRCHSNVLANEEGAINFFRRF